MDTRIPPGLSYPSRTENPINGGIPDMPDIKITDHAYDRAKERLGFNRKALARMAEIAFLEGIGHSETSGRLHKYIAARAASYMRKGQALRMYGEAVYCFNIRNNKATGKEETVLITVWAIPKNLKNQALGLQKRKKEGLGK